VLLHGPSDEEGAAPRTPCSCPGTSDSAECLRRRTNQFMLQAIIIRGDCRNYEGKYAKRTQQMKRSAPDSVSKCPDGEGRQARQQQTEMANRAHAAILFPMRQMPKTKLRTAFSRGRWFSVCVPPRREEFKPRKAFWLVFRDRPASTGVVGGRKGNCSV
jgi:hypothetical protein